MDIKDANIEELIEEIKRKKQIAEELNKPKLINEINLDGLKQVCQEYINQLSKKGRVKEDLEHYIFEEAMNCLYGHQVWDWINKKMK